MAGDVLDRFSPATAAWFRGRSARPRPPRTARGRRSAPATTRWWWRRPVRARRCRRSSGRSTGWPAEPPPDDAAAALPGALRLAAQGAGRRRRAQPAVPAGRHRPRRRPARACRAPDITVAVRSGDTPADERRAFARTPSDILITTPESLFLMLTSSAREALTGVETVIVDEVHAVAGTKRGAHLALSLERLDAAAAASRRSGSGCRRPCARSRRSPATSPAAVRSRSCSRPRPRSGTSRSSCRVPDMSALGELTERPVSGPAAGEQRRASIWPHVEERIVDLVADAPLHPGVRQLPAAGRAADRAAQRDLGGAAGARGRGGDCRRGESPGDARVCRTDRRVADRHTRPGAGHGAVRRVARRARRARPRPPRLGEQGAARRASRRTSRPAGCPRSSRRAASSSASTWARSTSWSRSSRRRRVASGLQRVGRAGHQVGAVVARRAVPEVPRRPRADRGRRRADARRRDRVAARAGQPARRARPAGRRDVRAWTSGRSTTSRPWSGGRRRSPALTRARCSSRCSTCSPGATRATSSPSCGRGSSGTACTDILTGRRGAQRLAVTSRRHDPRPRAVRRVPRRRRGRRAPGRRARRGDGLRVAGRRRVHPGHVAPGGSRTSPTTRCWSRRRPDCPGGCRSGRATRSAGPPSWAGRSARSSARSAALTPAGARERVAAAGLDDWAADNLLGYLDEQREATRHVPDDRTIVVERFRDELGDWRVAVLSPFGAQVHAPVGAGRRGPDARAVRGRRAGDARRRRHRAPAARPRVRATSSTACREPGVGRELLDLVTLDPDDVHDLVTERDRRFGAVRGAVPRVRGPGPAAAAAPSRPAPAAVAAAPAGLPAARGGQPVPARSRSCSRRCASACRTSSTCRAWST